MLEERVRETIARHGMLPRGETILVAVSGGVDSVSLLEILSRLSVELELTLVVAHLDHTLRGEESRADAVFVQDLASAKGLRVIVETADVRALARRRKVGLEEAGREARHAFLEGAARAVGATRIALGHTLDDRVETVLFHLVRGAGAAGLVGIRPVALPYVRPLIEARRAEVAAFARREGLTWREDASNADLRFSRNRMRHEVIPSLLRLNPRAPEAVARAAELLAEEEAALEVLLDPLWAEAGLRQEPGNVSLRRNKLAAQPRSIQRLLLRRAIRRAAGSLDRIEKRHVDALCDLVAGSGSGEGYLPGLVARVDQAEIRIETRGSSRPRGEGFDLPLPLGRTALPEVGLSFDLRLEEAGDARSLLSNADRHTEFADADAIAFPLRVRSRREGDRFQPLGMSVAKRLSDFLLDERVPASHRASLPLVCDQRRIVWVVGVRLSEGVRLSPATRRVLVLRAEEVG